jgi:hypothetical protein
MGGHGRGQWVWRVWESGSGTGRDWAALCPGGQLWASSEGQGALGVVTKSGPLDSFSPLNHLGMRYSHKPHRWDYRQERVTHPPDVTQTTVRSRSQRPATLNYLCARH